MAFNQRFDEQFRSVLREMGEGDGMSFRAESIEVVEQSIKLCGLEGIVSDYLATHFDAGSLAELSDGDLARAFRYIAQLERRGAVRPLVPLRADGEMLLVRGTFSWG